MALKYETNSFTEIKLEKLATSAQSTDYSRETYQKVKIIKERSFSKFSNPKSQL